MSKSNENISSLQKKGDIERSQRSGKVTINELRELRNLQEEIDLQMQGPVMYLENILMRNRQKVGPSNMVRNQECI